MRRFLLTAATTALLSGCVTAANYQAVLDSWVGRHSDELLSEWGAPDASVALQGGGSVLEYSRQYDVAMGGRSYTTPQTTYHQGRASAYGTGGYATGSYSGTTTTQVVQNSPKYNINMSCSTRFTTDRDGIIVSHATRGNDCRSR